MIAVINGTVSWAAVDFVRGGTSLTRVDVTLNILLHRSVSLRDVRHLDVLVHGATSGRGSNITSRSSNINIGAGICAKRSVLLLCVDLDGAAAGRGIVVGGHLGVSISPSANKLSISVVVATGSVATIGLVDKGLRVVARIAISILSSVILLALLGLLNLILLLLHFLQLDLLLGDLDCVVLVRRLLGVHNAAEAQHASNNCDGYGEHDHRVDC